jgi:glucitol/sorbitol PTS system EIIC component
VEGIQFENSIGQVSVLIDIFISYLVAVGPYLLVILTANAFLSKLIKKEWLFHLAEKYGHLWLIRYTLLPILGLFVMANPSCYELGDKLKEDQKPAFYDASVSFCHPVTGFFPYSNSGELFFLIGALYPIVKLELSLWTFALIYFLAGIAVMWIRGTVTELLTKKYLKQVN